MKRSRLDILIRLARRDEELTLRALGQARVRLEAHEGALARAQAALRDADQRARAALGPGRALATASLVADARHRANLDTVRARLARDAAPLREAFEQARGALARARLRRGALEDAAARRAARARLEAQRRATRRIDDLVRGLRALEEDPDAAA